MQFRLWIIGMAVLLIGGLWLLSMRLTPHRGLLKLLEKLCAGVILCYCLALLARPLGLCFPQSPIAAAFAGALGLPGAALSFWIGSGM